MNEQTAPVSNSRRVPIRQATLTLKTTASHQAIPLLASQRIGSAPGNEIRIEEPTVSRLHAELRTTEDGVWVRDLGSKNGTEVNGVTVREALVPEGATLCFGQVEATVSYGEVDTQPLPKSARYDGLVGVSAAMRLTFSRLQACAQGEGFVLLRGETGTGKELAARAIHAASSRAARPFVVVDCAALFDSSLEAELFGGAEGPGGAARQSCFEAASGGTVFLDEIGELSLSVQHSLLRVLQGQGIRQPGAATTRPVDFRLIVSTHQDLLRMVNVGAFREDLYFRIAVLPLELPPLRERIEDVPVLARHFLGSRSWPEALDLEQMMSRAWLGNVRELKNVVERACAKIGEPSASGETLGESEHTVRLPSCDRPLREFREHWNDAGEERYLKHLLGRTDGKVSAAAKLAGVDRTYIYRLIRRHRRDTDSVG